MPNDLIRIPVTVEGVSYPVLLTAGLDGLGDALTEVFPAGRRCVLVTNTVVGPLHRDQAVAGLTAAGWEISVVTITDGEERKDADNWLSCVYGLLDARVDRKTPVLALGGGVTGDLVGFAAASVLRGVPFVQVPTTLLAMVDASVGGKVGINTAHGKNLLGAFWQPSLVYAAQSTLRTLPDEEMRCGLGEVVKHAVLSGEEALRAVEERADALVARDPGALAEVVADSVRCKAAVVAADPRENGVRATLNLGHTLGHAVERVAGYGAIRHGEAVALGLVGMCRFAASRGWITDPALPARIGRLLERLGLPIEAPPGLDPAALVEAAGFDKKRTRGTLLLVVPVAAGNVQLRSLPLDEVPELVSALYAPPVPTR